MNKYRLGITDTYASGATLWYDQESYDDAYLGWRLIHDYGRSGVIAQIQEHKGDEWVTVR